jgi:PAS domain-containing protein
MRLLKRMLVLAARLGSMASLAVLLGGRTARAFDGQGEGLAQTALIGMAIGAGVTALVLLLLVSRARARALHHAELIQLAGVPEDNPYPIMRIAASGEVRYANASANGLLGRIGADPELWSQWQDALRAMRGTGRTERRFEIGDRVFLLSAVTDSTACLNIFVLEVTDLFAKEHALSRSEARLALVTRTARLGLFEIDVPKRTITYNDIYAWQLGIGPVSYTESLDLWAERIHPADREAALRAMQDFTAGRMGRYRMEHRLNNGRGGWLWVSAIAEVTEIEPTGLPRQIIGSHLDVTELKATEVALERINRRNLAQLDLVTLGDSGSESAVLACSAQHGASVTESPSGVIQVVDDKGMVEATYRFGPSDDPRRASETRLESEIRDSGRVVARLTVGQRPMNRRTRRACKSSAPRPGGWCNGSARHASSRSSPGCCRARSTALSSPIQKVAWNGPIRPSSARPAMRSTRW